jgi:hypothetical protein
VTLVRRFDRDCLVIPRRAHTDPGGAATGCDIRGYCAGDMAPRSGERVTQRRAAGPLGRRIRGPFAPPAGPTADCCRS